MEVVFLGAEFGYGVQGKWLPPGWAIAQEVWAVLHLIAGVVFIPLGALADSDGLLGVGIASAVLGTWYVTDGIISLAKWRRPERSSLAPPEGPRLSVDHPYLPRVSLAATHEGAFGTFSWTF